LKQELEQLLLASLEKLVGGVLSEMPDAASVAVERTRDAQHGEFATNLALRLAKAARKNPRELAAAIVAALPANPLVARAEVAGAGFINFHLAAAAYQRELASIHARAGAYGESSLGAGERVLVEFVSANPTGPLHVGHGRQAAYGATLANILRAVGYRAEREYYINDAGRQMDILAVSTWVRYLEAWGEVLPFPQNGYRGDYVRPLAQRLQAAAGQTLRRPAASVLANLPADAPDGDKEAYIDALIARCRELIGAEGFRQVLDLSLAHMLGDIREDLAEFGVLFDHWTSERAVADSGAIDHALAVLQSQGRLERKDGALWFRASEFGDEKDRVVRACGAHRHGPARRLPRGDADPVRQPVPRRREDPDGQARGAVRDAAAAAREGRQRRLPLLLPHAQPRPAAGLRSGAGQVAHQREPGLLHPVRARARRQRHETARGARPGV
jgi:arginyl-tRNA synthetase